MTAILKCVTLCLIVLFTSGRAGPESDAAAALQALISSAERMLVGVAREMPEDKYDFAPTAGEFRGVRTFARQLKHAAAVQYLIAASILGEPVTAEMVEE